MVILVRPFRRVQLLSGVGPLDVTHSYVYVRREYVGTTIDTHLATPTSNPSRLPSLPISPKALQVATLKRGLN